jgi:hypothetical protein
LGGAWDEQEYQFTFPDARSPFHRARNCGFRCAKYLPGEEPPAAAIRDQEPLVRDFLQERRLTDAEFKLVKDELDYAKRELNAQRVQDLETAEWVVVGRWFGPSTRALTNADEEGQ